MYLLLQCIIGASLSACAQATRYKVLTFFFTGVPEPGAKIGTKTAVATQTGALTARSGERKTLAYLTQAQFFVHGPYGAGECERCHATTASQQFRTGGEQVTTAVVSQSQNIGPRLAVPLEELCVTCHSEKSNEAAVANNLWQHGPVANGWCTMCHSPHRAARQYMLLKDNNVDLCTQCHTKDDLQITPEHTKNPAENCIDCHNPHLGRNAYLLKAEYDEW